MTIGKDRATIKGAMGLLEKVIKFYNDGYDADIIAIMTGLKTSTVEVLLDIADAVAKEAEKRK